MVLGLWLLKSPMDEQDDNQAAEHAQNPQGIGAADPAAVVIEGDVQALMSPVFDSPAHAVGFEPELCGKFFGYEVSDEADSFVFASDMLTAQQSNLSGKGEADVLGGCRAAL